MRKIKEEEYCQNYSFWRGTKGQENVEGISCFLFPDFVSFFLSFFFSKCHADVFCHPHSCHWFTFFCHFFCWHSSLLTQSPHFSFSFRLSFVYSWRVIVWQLSLLDLPMGGNPGFFTRSHFRCWLSIDYLWQQTLLYCLPLCLHSCLSFWLLHDSTVWVFHPHLRLLIQFKAI